MTKIRINIDDDRNGAVRIKVDKEQYIVCYSYDSEKNGEVKRIKDKDRYYTKLEHATEYILRRFNFRGEQEYCCLIDIRNTIKAVEKCLKEINIKED